MNLKCCNNLNGTLSRSQNVNDNQRSSSAEEERNKKIRVKYVLMYVKVEENKEDSVDTITEEYTEKAILFGYLIIFGCSFNLGPLIFLFHNLVDIRADAWRLLWLYKRPVGYTALDIGI